MNTEFPPFRTPTDDTSIWRYVDITKLLAMLEGQTLYFSRADLLGDKYEGAYPEKTFDFTMSFPANSTPDLDDWYAEIKKTASKSAKGLRNTMFLNCWHMSEHESAAMWRLYLQSNEGVAIRSTFGRLKESLSKTSQNLYFAAVNYIDYAKDVIPLGSVFNPYIYKRKSFSHETELRVMYWHIIDLKEILEGKKTAVAGFNLQADLDKLIESIYVAPTASAWFRDLTENILKRYNLPRPAKQSDLDLDPVW